jgi:hypothetical protein
MKIDKVIIYGDSTSLPRPTDLVETSDTYYWKIIRYLGDECSLENRSVGGVSVKKLRRKMLDDAHYLFPGNFLNDKKLVILNMGVVDAGVHPITYKLKAIIRVPILGRYIWAALAKTINPYRAKIIKIWKYSIVSPAKFSQEFEKMIKFLLDRDVLICVLLTPIPGRYIESRSPGFSENVKKYNSIKSKICEQYPTIHLINLDKFLDTHYVSDIDGHHYSKAGHSYIFNEIRSKLFLNA